MWPGSWIDRPASGGWIDRPASRGQEYRREKNRKGWVNNKPSAASNSSLTKSGSHGQLITVSTEGGPRPRFLGIPWPPGQPGSRRRRSGSTEFQDVDLYGQGGGAGLDESPPGVAGSGVDGRLRVSIDGHTELGKGIAGHTAYMIKVECENDVHVFQV